MSPHQLGVLLDAHSQQPWLPLYFSRTHYKSIGNGLGRQGHDCGWAWLSSSSPFISSLPPHGGLLLLSGLWTAASSPYAINIDYLLPPCNSCYIHAPFYLHFPLSLSPSSVTSTINNTRHWRSSNSFLNFLYLHLILLSLLPLKSLLSSSSTMKLSISTAPLFHFLCPVMVEAGGIKDKGKGCFWEFHFQAPCCVRYRIEGGWKNWRIESQNGRESW